MTWPFKKHEEPVVDTRPVSVAARAVAKSLETEPTRWKPQAVNGAHYLLHDANIAVDMEGWIRQPNLDTEPDANAEFMQAAIEKWIEARLAVPASRPPGAAMNRRPLKAKSRKRAALERKVNP